MKIMKNKLILFSLLFLALINIANAEDCIPNWQCTNWSDCIGNKQIRSCIDLNTCADFTGKPTEEKICGTVCNPNWQCTEWIPEVCPKNKLQSRNCTDIKNCGTNKGKPIETKICNYKQDLSWIFKLIIIIIVFLIIINVSLIISLFKKPTIKKKRIKNLKPIKKISKY